MEVEHLRYNRAGWIRPKVSPEEIQRQTEECRDKLFSHVEENESAQLNMVVRDLCRTTTSKTNISKLLAEAMLMSVRLESLDCLKELLVIGINADLGLEGVNADMMLEGCPLLLEAVTYSKYEVMEFLIKEGADVNLASQHFRHSPLHTAVYNDDIIAANMLFRYGADPDVRDRSGNTPLMNAVTKDNAELVELILYNGASVNIRNRKEEWPIQKAVVLESSRILEMLLKAGADPNVRCYGVWTEDWTPSLLHKAIKKNNMEIIELLLRHGAWVEGSQYTTFPLTYAISSGGNIATIELLLRYGADPSPKPHYCYWPLLQVLEHSSSDNSIPLIQCLIKHGANLNDLNRYGANVLAHYLFDIYKGRHRLRQRTVNFEAINFLIASGSHLHSDICTSSPIHLASTFEENETTFNILKALMNADFTLLNIKAHKVLGSHVMPQVYPVEMALNMQRYKILYFYILAGSNNESLFRARQRIAALPDKENIGFHGESMSDILHMLKKPRTLTDICVHTVRSQVTFNLSENITVLPLPKLLKDIISLDHIGGSS